MSAFSRFHKLALVGLGAIGGGIAYYRLNSGENEKKLQVHNSWTTNFTPSVQWDKNWDLREPESLVKPLGHKHTAEDENLRNEQLEKSRSRATRHLFLIRHGQYNLDGLTDKERVLTELGRHQADLTGERLKTLNISWDLIVRSTMTRAQETAKIIQKHLPEDIEVKDCQLIEEGAPIPPEPPVGHWQPERKQFFQDSARIEAGFRRYFYRAPPEQTQDSYTLMVCHANVIRFYVCKTEAGFRWYFYRAPPEQTQDSYTLMVCHANVIRFYVCKALQFPPEGWLRMSLNHGSITWISILPSGNVVLRTLGDTGHMPPESVTSRGGGTKKSKKEKKVSSD